MLAFAYQKNEQTVEFHFPPSCKIFVDNKEVNDLYPYIKEVSVNSARTQASDATIEFLDRIMFKDGDKWVVQDDTRLAVGASVKLVMTFDKSEQTLFTGFLVKTSSKFTTSQGEASVTVECQDETVKLDQDHKTIQRQIDDAEGSKLSDGAIVKSILNNYGFQKLDGVIAEGMTCEKVAQNGSDIQLINARARANGYEFYISNGRPYFGPMQLDGTPQWPDIKLQFGRHTNCLKFDVSNDVMSPIKVFLEEITPKKGGKPGINKTHVLTPNLTLLGDKDARTESTSLGRSDWFLSKTETAKIKEALALAQFKINEASMRIKATGEIDGLLYKNVLRTGRTVKVVGAGLRNSGIYYVDEVKHSISSSGYTQSFKLLRNAISTKATKPSEAALSEAVLGEF